MTPLAARLALFGLVGCLALVGCSARPAAGPPAYPVRGKLTHQGKPMRQAQITFHPASDPTGHALGALARADDDGVYRMTTYTVNDGLPAGDYLVTLQWPNPKLRKVGPDGVETEDVLPDLLRGAYANRAKARLRATVRAEPNEIDFNLP